MLVTKKLFIVLLVAIAFYAGSKVAAKPTPAPSFVRFNSVVDKKAQQPFALAGQALVVASDANGPVNQSGKAIGNGLTKWNFVKGTDIDSDDNGSPATNGKTLVATGTGSSIWSNLPTTLPPNGAAGGDLTGTYPNPSIAANAVTTAKITDGGVTTGKIADAGVTTAKLADGATTSAKIADSAVTTTKLLTGAVTPSKVGGYDSVSVGLAANVTIPNNTNIRLPFNSEFFDSPSNLHDNTSNPTRITIAQDGRYLVIAHVAVSIPAGNVPLALYKNSSILLVGTQAPSAISTIVKLSTGDFIELDVHNNGTGGTLTVSPTGAAWSISQLP